MTAPTIDTTALADLDINLDETIPCESTEGCDQPADWRGTAKHVGGGACHTRFFCAKHVRRMQHFLALPGKNICRIHGHEVWIHWQPLGR